MPKEKRLRVSYLKLSAPVREAAMKAAVEFMIENDQVLLFRRDPEDEEEQFEHYEFLINRLHPTLYGGSYTGTTANIYPWNGWESKFNSPHRRYLESEMVPYRSWFNELYKNGILINQAVKYSIEELGKNPEEIFFTLPAGYKQTFYGGKVNLSVEEQNYQRMKKALDRMMEIKEEKEERESAEMVEQVKTGEITSTFQRDVLVRKLLKGDIEASEIPLPYLLMVVQEAKRIQQEGT